MRKRIVLLIVTFLLMAAALPPASAKTYDYIINGGVKLPTLVGYRFSSVLNSAPVENEYLKAPQGMYIDHEDSLYIADSGNNRVLKFNAGLAFVMEVTLSESGAPLKDPRGVYVDKRSHLFIADTGNSRVVHTAADGTFIEEFTAPDSPLFDIESHGFTPVKVMVDHFGYLCVINGSDYHGIVRLDLKNGFAGYYGANKVTTSLFDYIIRYFGSEAQKDQTIKKQPPYITGMSADSDGYVFTSNALVKNQEIKRLDQGGYNVYPNTGTFLEQEQGDPGLLTDIHVSDGGIVTVTDSIRRKVYQYDRRGNMLSAFGGQGMTEGTFSYPVGVSADSSGRLYVLDRDAANVQIFERTAFMQDVHDYISLYDRGEYEACLAAVQKVLCADSTYLLAYNTLGDLHYKQKDYAAAMRAYETAGNMQGYSNAFDKNRQEVYRVIFLPLIAGIFLLVFGAAFFLSKTRRRARRIILDGYTNKERGKAGPRAIFDNILCVLYYPSDGYERLRRRRPYIQALILYVSVCAVHIVSLMYTHLPLASVKPADADLFFEICKMMIPLLTFVLVSYGMSTLHDGEAKMKHVFTGTAFSMLPYIILTPLLTLGSHIMSVNDLPIYAALHGAVWIWVLFQFYRQINILNNYSFPQTVGLIVLTVLGMLAVWVLLALVYFLFRNLWFFIVDLWVEIMVTGG